ncbi:HAMP domain-containing sensor histidine kinase [Mycolicibacterium sp. 050158]|uniref:sensor histidine kinase n=1 Tax=Mycolicibacterium sp. 050158 TaxID=3090602 RepID=UPI00299DB171|nr:HAMP domain-containing sensor histidine kinase [Mycolicibacterium sp. 050158]MDX1893092.1 HAMP domain-containing sensor histidine kinase [Mycolicibacterium sp. 050158]
MSSNLISAADRARVVRLFTPRTWPLRIRLVAVVTGLGICLCFAVGAGTLLAMRRYLMGQLDDQVLEAQSRSTTFYEMGRPPAERFSGPGPMFLDGPGQSAGTVGATRSDDSVIEAAVITPTGNRVGLSPAAVAELARVPTTGMVSLALDGVGEYRLTAVPIGETNAVVVSGLPMADVEATLASAAWIIAVSSTVALLATISAVMVIIRRQLDPLSRMSLAAQRVARLQLDRGEVRLPTPLEPVDPATAHTEIGRLGTAFNTMVDRVAEGLTARHTSETRVRQFVADASHELRTPLASIQGYTEFAAHLVGDLDEQGHLRNRSDLAHALGRVRDESRRMNELVEDMLLLARLDTGRPVEREPVDVSDLLINAVHDAHIAGPDHRWVLDIPPDTVSVIGDRSRLFQAMANLLSNARVHTPAGTKIVTSVVSNVDRSVTLTILDDGPGIPSGLLPNVFERFARGDGSRSRAAGSTGLGLAITRAVVIAHHGVIEVESSGNGTCFTVTLPVSADG